MNNPNCIEAGDEVQIETLHFDHYTGTVISKPAGPGDCWVIRDKFGNISHFQNFSVITRYAPQVDKAPEQF